MDATTKLKLASLLPRAWQMNCMHQWKDAMSPLLDKRLFLQQLPYPPWSLRCNDMMCYFPMGFIGLTKGHWHWGDLERQQTRTQHKMAQGPKFNSPRTNQWDNQGWNNSQQWLGILPSKTHEPHIIHSIPPLSFNAYSQINIIQTEHQSHQHSNNTQNNQDEQQTTTHRREASRDTSQQIQQTERSWQKVEASKTERKQWNNMQWMIS